MQTIRLPRRYTRQSFPVVFKTFPLPSNARRRSVDISVVRVEEPRGNIPRRPAHTPQFFTFSFPPQAQAGARSEAQTAKRECSGITIAAVEACFRRQNQDRLKTVFAAMVTYASDRKRHRRDKNLYEAVFAQGTMTTRRYKAICFQEWKHVKVDRALQEARSNILVQKGERLAHAVRVRQLQGVWGSWIALQMDKLVQERDAERSTVSKVTSETSGIASKGMMQRARQAAVLAKMHKKLLVSAAFGAWRRETAEAVGASKKQAEDQRLVDTFGLAKQQARAPFTKLVETDLRLATLKQVFEAWRTARLERLYLELSNTMDQAARHDTAGVLKMAPQHRAMQTKLVSQARGVQESADRIREIIPSPPSGSPIVEKGASLSRAARGEKDEAFRNFLSLGAELAEAKSEQNATSGGPTGGGSRPELAEAKNEQNATSGGPTGGGPEPAEAKNEQNATSGGPTGGEPEPAEAKNEQNATSGGPTGGGPREQFPLFYPEIARSSSAPGVGAPHFSFDGGAKFYLDQVAKTHRRQIRHVVHFSLNKQDNILCHIVFRTWALIPARTSVSSSSSDARRKLQLLRSWHHATDLMKHRRLHASVLTNLHEGVLELMGSFVQKHRMSRIKKIALESLRVHTKEQKLGLGFTEEEVDHTFSEERELPEARSAILAGGSKLSRQTGKRDLKLREEFATLGQERPRTGYDLPSREILARSVDIGEEPLVHAAHQAPSYEDEDLADAPVFYPESAGASFSESAEAILCVDRLFKRTSSPVVHTGLFKRSTPAWTTGDAKKSSGAPGKGNRRSVSSTALQQNVTTPSKLRLPKPRTAHTTPTHQEGGQQSQIVGGRSFPRGGHQQVQASDHTCSPADVARKSMSEHCLGETHSSFSPMARRQAAEPKVWRQAEPMVFGRPDGGGSQQAISVPQRRGPLKKRPAPGAPRVEHDHEAKPKPAARRSLVGLSWGSPKAKGASSSRPFGTGAAATGAAATAPVATATGPTSLAAMNIGFSLSPTETEGQRRPSASQWPAHHILNL